LNNLKQVTLCWILYAQDYNDALCANDGASGWITEKGTDGNGEAWGANDINTNTSMILSSTAAANSFLLYNKNPGIYRCPGDSIPSQNGTRLRTYTLSGAMNNSSSASSEVTLRGGNATGVTYIRATKMNNLSQPGPANCFTFVDENTYTLLVSGGVDFSFTPGLPAASEFFQSLPGTYHGSAGNISFADGHGEQHKWLDPVVTKYKSVYNSINTGGANIGTRNSLDYDWFNQRMPHQ
jgi:prepilin-type processing-associated H-X9-DG protein